MVRNILQHQVVPLPEPLETEEEAERSDAEDVQGTWSAGAVHHAQGQCRPCHYVNTKVGCVNGDACAFCHLAHPRRLRARPCKSKRSKCKRLAGMLDTVLAQDPQQFQKTAATL